jgi:hypothetical protein
MDLTKLVDGIPDLLERIGGVEVVFSEVPIEGLARLQAWIKANVPHPLEAIRDYLAKLPPGVASDLAEKARRDAMNWPPEIGTAEAAVALLGSTEGQVAAFLEGLLVHHPDATPSDARRLYNTLKREVAMDLARRKRKAELEILYQAMLDCDERITIDDAMKVLREIKAASVEDKRVKRIYATIFGTATADEEDEVRALKNGRAPVAASTGA